MRFRVRANHLLRLSSSETRVTPFAAALRIAMLMAVMGLSSWASPQSPVPQYRTTNDEHPAPHVVLKSLVPPLYPSTAIAQGIDGDVRLKVSVRADGSVESVTAIDGNRILIQAAVESAKQSQFECKGCAGLTETSLTYSFKRPQSPPDPCCCTEGHESSNKPTTEVSEPEGHITITHAPLCVCPDACALNWAREHSTFRSAKCLYLWKCGTRHITVR